MEIDEQMARRWEKSQRRGKVAGGILITIIGVLFLSRELGAELPAEIFSWKALLIGIGLVGFIKHGFRRLGWLIPIIVGGAFMFADVFPELSLKPVLFPSLLILIGLVIAFKPRRHHRHHYFYKQWAARHKRQRDYCYEPASNSGEDFIDSTSVMGGVKKVILSKNFKGGDITNVFGGTELNLMQADFQGKVRLEITQVFGGTKLYVPAHWQIHSQIVTVMGSVEDKRPVSTAGQTTGQEDKVLLLEGTTFFGGLEIRTF